MFNIEKIKKGSELTLFLKGRLDTQAAQDLAQATEYLAKVRTLILDFRDLDYISSAGLRILLAAQKRMDVDGIMLVRNVSPRVMEILDVTGFSSILTIE
jgi:anti-sigma B factor antagonist